MGAKRRIIPLFVPHLGCPHACVFCDQRAVSGAREPVTAADVTRALAEAEARFPAGAELAFYGGSFTAIPADEQEALLSAAAPFLERGFLASLRVSTRPDRVDGPALARLRRYGVRTVELGAQSMDEAVLRLAGRGHSAEDTRRAAALVKAGGFALVLQMMTGLPGSDREKDLFTARELLALGPDGLRVYPTVILRDTALCALWRAGKYREHTVEEAVETCAAILELTEAAGVPVTRLGLNPTEELSAGGAVAGAYHPALGELARARLMLRRAERLLRRTPHGEAVTLGVAPERLSQMTGQKKENLALLRQEFGLKSIRVKPAAVRDGEVVLL